jgi:hypothetical protein
MMFLARLVQDADQAAVFLACDGDMPACYTRELRDVRPDWMECLLCRAGGVRSFTGTGLSSIGGLASDRNLSGLARAREWASSSASTLGRFESPADYESPAFRVMRDRLAPGAQRAYSAARAWIGLERLDAVCVFNGRMDATRAIFEAARDAGIRAVSFERSWFGDGLQILPDENCLGLHAVHAMVGEWSSRPLTLHQALHSAGRIASRLTRTNTTEWRAYNTQARRGTWPAQDGSRRILLLPGSLNEIWGDPEWQSSWSEATADYDAIIDHLKLSRYDVVLRCHPNWGERIGKNDGRLPERYYTDWARARGVHVIASRDTVSTMDLIAQCDAVVLANGSAALEAAAMGKQVIATAPSIYQEAGFRTDVSHPDKLQSLRLQVDATATEQAALQRQLRRLALRFCYTMTNRLPQYVAHVRALSSWQYRYPPGADPQRILEIIRSGRLQADDAAFADNEESENEVLQRMEAGDWSALIPGPQDDLSSAPRVNRRWLLRPVDFVRRKMPVGDR